MFSNYVEWGLGVPSFCFGFLGRDQKSSLATRGSIVLSGMVSRPGVALIGFVAGRAFASNLWYLRHALTFVAVALALPGLFQKQWGQDERISFYNVVVSCAMLTKYLWKG